MNYLFFHRFSRATNKLLKPIFDGIGIDSITYHSISSDCRLTKLGTDYGGWTICDDLINTNSICYCVGCGEDISFDLELISKYGCTVYAFDPTPRAIEYVQKNTAEISRYNFFDYGLWDKEDVLKFYGPKNSSHVSHSALNIQKTDYYFDARVRRLSDIMNSFGHTEIDLLKLDIEGAEYKVLKSILEDKIKIKILCVEFDEWQNPVDKNYKKRIQGTVMNLIETGYTLVYADTQANYTFSGC